MIVGPRVSGLIGPSTVWTFPEIGDLVTRFRSLRFRVFSGLVFGLRRSGQAHPELMSCYIERTRKPGRYDMAGTGMKVDEFNSRSRLTLKNNRLIPAQTSSGQGSF